MAGAFCAQPSGNQMRPFSARPIPGKRLVINKPLIEMLDLGIEQLPSYTERIGLIYVGLTLLLELRDLWLGVYWDYRPPQMGPAGRLKNHSVTIYLCLVPCLPLRLSLVFSKPEQRP